MSLSSFLLKSVVMTAAITSSCFAASSSGGFSLGSTRVIYDAGKKDAALTVINSANNASFLAQSWISNINDAVKDKPPFVLTPPLYRQDKGKNTLRIVKTAQSLPADKESAYWINVKAIPAQKKQSGDENSISLAYVLKIKMFYRPSGLSGSANNAYKELTFSRDGTTLTAKNPTPYYVTLNKVSVAGKQVEDVTAMVAPFASQTYQLTTNTKGNDVEYRAVNDQGGVMPAVSKKIN